MPCSYGAASGTSEGRPSLETTMHVSDYQVIDHGEDGSSYFPGCGTAYTPFAHAVTGMGDTAREALEDALEQMAMNDHETTGSMEENMLSYLPTNPDVSAHDSLEPHDCEKDGCDWNHYVSVRYNVVVP